MTPKPIFSFDNVNSTGLDKVPLNSVVVVESTGQQVMLTNKTTPVAVGPTTTISELLASPTQAPTVGGLDWTVDQGTTDIHPNNYTNTTYGSSDFVDLTTNQSLAGVKTFSAKPIFNAGVQLNDNDIIVLGTGSDWEFFHNGVDNYIDCNVGNMYVRDNTTTRFTFARTTGNFTATGDISAFSDIKLKENIEVIPNAMNKILQVSGYTYDRIDNPEIGRQTGVIAQEIQAVIPEAVNESEDGTLSVSYGNLVGLLIEGIKELKAEIEILKAK